MICRSQKKSVFAVGQHPVGLVLAAPDDLRRHFTAVLIALHHHVVPVDDVEGPAVDAFFRLGRKGEGREFPVARREDRGIHADAHFREHGGPFEPAPFVADGHPMGRLIVLSREHVGVVQVDKVAEAEAEGGSRQLAVEEHTVTSPWRHPSVEEPHLAAQVEPAIGVVVQRGIVDIDEVSGQVQV